MSDDTGAQLRQFIEQIEQLDAEKREIADHIKAAFAAAKAAGFDTKVMRKVIAIRKRRADDLAEEQALLELYLGALGQ